MDIKADLKLVLKEISPILAGFKLAVIVIGYFGLGSVAKWVISYWYPFTRWVWDYIALQMSLPVFPIIIKDSLTALVFFLPLGITAVIQLLGKKNSDVTHRVMGAVFGALFLFIICKDIVASIYDSLFLSVQTLSSSKGSKFPIWATAVLFFIYLFLAGIAAYLLKKARNADPKERLLTWIKLGENKFIRYVEKNRLRMFSIGLAISGVFIWVYGSSLVREFGPTLAPSITGAMAILMIIIVSLLLAIIYAPRKLYITTGAAIAFVLAAILFEAFITAKSFMESVA